MEIRWDAFLSDASPYVNPYISCSGFKLCLLSPHRFQSLFILYMVLILVVALGFNRGSMEGTAAHTAATKALMEA